MRCVCIIYFNIFRSSRINRLLLHPFGVCCIRFHRFIFIFIHHYICNRRVHQVFRTRMKIFIKIFENTQNLLVSIWIQLQVELNAWMKWLHWRHKKKEGGGWCSSVRAKNVSIITFMYVQYIFCCVKENMIAFLSLLCACVSLFANKINETDKIFIILMCVRVCAHPTPWFLRE